MKETPELKQGPRRLRLCAAITLGLLAMLGLVALIQNALTGLDGRSMLRPSSSYRLATIACTFIAKAAASRWCYWSWA